MLQVVRFLFKATRGIFRFSRIGKIKVVKTFIYIPIRRKLYRFVWRFIAPNLDKVVEIGGHKISGIGSNRGGLNGMGLLMDAYEESSSYIFKDFIQPGNNVIDIGAHIGYYTLLAAREVGPSGMVFAFEPEIENCKWLEKNIKSNNYKNVKIVTKAVTEKTGTLNLWLGNSSGSHSIFQSFDGIKKDQNKNMSPNQKSQLVESISIDNFLEQEGFPDIGVIKIDAEGAEKSVFDGMNKLLRRQNNLKIIFEFNRINFEKNNISSLSLLTDLQEKDFDLYSIENKKLNLLSAEDIIFLSEKSMTNRNLLAIKEMNED